MRLFEMNEDDKSILIVAKYVIQMINPKNAFDSINEFEIQSEDFADWAHHLVVIFVSNDKTKIYSDIADDLLYFEKSNEAFYVPDFTRDKSAIMIRVKEHSTAAYSQVKHILAHELRHHWEKIVSLGQSDSKYRKEVSQTDIFKYKNYFNLTTERIAHITELFVEIIDNIEESFSSIEDFKREFPTQRDHLLFIVTNFPKDQTENWWKSYSTENKKWALKKLSKIWTAVVEGKLDLDFQG